MRIAYVTVHIEPRIINGGVGSKINSQLHLWRSMGHVAGLFSLTPAPISAISDAHQFPFQSSSMLPGIKFLSRELSRSLQLARLISAVRAYRPDLIYFRFGLFAFPLQTLFSVAPVVLEINSNDSDEYRARGGVYHWLNAATRGIVFSRCAGWIAPSHELATLPQNRPYGKPVCVISNGIQLDKYEPLDAPHQQRPRLALVGSPQMSWHGMDKLIPLAGRFPDMDFDIIGYSRDDLPGPIPENVHLHGYLEPKDVRNVLAQAHAVFGTLALHRKGMTEASPLKVREALAYGIPVILGYRDTDLADLDSDLILSLPNTETNILDHAGQIHEFAYRVRGRRVERGLIAKRLDQSHKEERRLEFFEEMLSSSRSSR